MAPRNARCSPPRDRGTSIHIDNLAAVDPTTNIETQRPAQGKSGGKAKDRDVLIVRADRRDALVVLPLKLATEIAVAAEMGKP
jgi:hypothetical protein